MSLSANVNEKAALIWAIADKLTGVYKPHEYGEVILPLTVIRRFDCILADTKDAVLEKYEHVKNDAIGLKTRCKDKGKTQYPPNFFATFFRHFEKQQRIDIKILTLFLTFKQNPNGV